MLFKEKVVLPGNVRNNQAWLVLFGGGAFTAGRKGSHFPDFDII